MRRVLVVGLDGGTFDVIRPLVAAGRLPCIAGLMERGVAGDLQSTFPPLTAPAWSSFVTGVNPGKHGLVDFVRRLPGGYDCAPVNASNRGAESLWSMVSRQGRRVVAVNVPVTYPPEPINGCLVSGMLTPPGASFTFPPGLAAELNRLTGGYRTHEGWAYARGRVERFLELVYRTTDVQMQAVEWLMKREAWDLFAYVFTGTDRIQHGLWHCMDPQHPFHPGEHSNPHRETIHRFYQRVDGMLSGLLSLAGNETVVVLMSDHGFGPFYKFIHLNNWLVAWGLLRFRTDPAVRLKQAASRCGLSMVNLYNALLALGMGRLKGVVSKGRHRDWLRRFFPSFADVDWSQTRAYSLGAVGQIYVNLRGREPEGIVAPGSEYETVRDEVIGRLQEMRDPESGDLLVERILRKEELYSGEFLDAMPDLVFIPRGFTYGAFGEYEFASAALVDVSRGITGWHRMEGILIMAGDGVARGEVIEGARLVDLAPTILHLLGLGIPAGLDGRVLEKALTGRDAPRRLPEASPIRIDSPAGYSEAEGNQITERLRRLGYLS